MVGEPKYLSSTIYNPLLFSLKHHPSAEYKLNEGRVFVLFSPDTQSQSGAWHLENVQWTFWINGY